jgi:hypothetical protein
MVQPEQLAPSSQITVGISWVPASNRDSLPTMAASRPKRAEEPRQYFKNARLLMAMGDCPPLPVNTDFLRWLVNMIAGILAEEPYPVILLK